MNNYYLILLLQLINANADTASLLRQGLTYAQISRLISQTISDGFIEENDLTGLSLTTKGLELIGGKSINNKMRGKANWISADNVSRINKMHKYDVYLPKKDIKF